MTQKVVQKDLKISLLTIITWGETNLKRQTFIYNDCGSTVYFRYAKSVDDCFGKFSGIKFQMINFEYCVMEEVKNYLLTRLRGH